MQTEVRAPIVEKSVQAPIIKKEGVIEPTRVVQKGLVIEEKPASIGEKITNVFSDIKNTIMGDEPKKK